MKHRVDRKRKLKELYAKREILAPAPGEKASKEYLSVLSSIHYYEHPEVREAYLLRSRRPIRDSDLLE